MFHLGVNRPVGFTRSEMGKRCLLTLIVGRWFFSDDKFTIRQVDYRTDVEAVTRRQSYFFGLDSAFAEIQSKELREHRKTVIADQLITERGLHPKEMRPAPPLMKFATRNSMIELTVDFCQINHVSNLVYCNGQGGSEFGVYMDIFGLDDRIINSVLEELRTAITHLEFRRVDGPTQLPVW